MYDIFFLVDHRLSDSIKKRFPLAKKASSIVDAKNKSMTKFFWVVDRDYSLLEDFKFDYKIPDWDQMYVHVWKTVSNDHSGVYLIPKKYEITNREAEYSFFIKRKEIDVIASKKQPYDIFYISKPNDYINAQTESTTKMFYAILDDVVVDPKFDFTYNVPNWDQEYVNVFSQSGEDTHGGVYLIPKNYNITKREAEYNFFIKNKKLDIVASKSGFDIIFISYDEPNAEENWKKLKERFPCAKRIHGVRGIHNAHIEAAKLSNTSMIWVVDGDAIVLDDFNFDITVEKWDREITHVCKSKNPINGLIYGYGGVKLLPRKLLLNVKTNTVDMTTSISKDFKALDVVSNITKFNTDPFNTWKSAFRECVKLSSKIIDGQLDIETQQRLDIWCTVGREQLYGKWALLGAQAGKEYGSQNKDNKEMLLKINDWKWLQDEFNRNN